MFHLDQKVTRPVIGAAILGFLLLIMAACGSVPPSLASISASSFSASLVGSNAFSHSHAGAGYQFKTLNDQADPTFNQLLGLNDHGVIAGYFGSGANGHPNKGYTLSRPYGQGQYTNENFPGSVQTQVTGINNAGNTVGFWVDGNGNNFGFANWNGVFTSYKDPNTGTGTVNQLLGLNDQGIAVGFLTASNGPVVGFLLKGKTFTEFDFPQSTNTTPLGVNKSDQIVGVYVDGANKMHGFLLSHPLDHARWQSIDDPNGVGTTTINGINNNADLVGFYVDGAGNTDGFLANSK
jgi:hypothetical protein